MLYRSIWVSGADSGKHRSCWPGKGRHLTTFLAEVGPEIPYLSIPPALSSAHEGGLPPIVQYFCAALPRLEGSPCLCARVPPFLCRRSPPPYVQPRPSAHRGGSHPPCVQLQPSAHVHMGGSHPPCVQAAPPRSRSKSKSNSAITRRPGSLRSS